jgi:hypothetical protein
MKSLQSDIWEARASFSMYVACYVGRDFELGNERGQAKAKAKVVHVWDRMSLLVRRAQAPACLAKAFANYLQTCARALQ